MTDLQAMLVAQEGERLLPYTDSVGKLTIGVGHNLSDKGITRFQSAMLLSDDIADATGDVRHVCSVYDQLSRPRQLCLISMAFNLGRERLSQFVRFLDAVHRSDWEDAADEMLDSKWAKQVGDRATVLSRMMRRSISEWI